MANYQEAKVKLKNTQLKTLKTASKIRQEQYYPYSGWAFLGWLTDGGRGKNALLSKIFRAYPTMMKHDTVILHVKKIYKIYESRDTPLEFF